MQFVRLHSSSVIKCEDIMSNLIKEWQIGRKRKFSLYSSSESTAVIINNLNNCTVNELDIQGTSFDIKCVSILLKILKTNKTIKRLWLYILFTYWWCQTSQW